MRVDFTTNLRGDLAARLRPINEFYAQLVTAPETQFQPVPTPFLTTSFVVQAQKFAPTRPILLYVGCGPDGQAFVLNGQPEEFNRMVHADGVHVRDAETAIELARTFLYVTRPQHQRYVVVSSITELPWRPNLEQDERNQRERATHEFGSVIRPPVAASRITEGFDVSAYVVHQMSLIEVVVAVASDGRATTTNRTLATDLPFTYSM